jgi:4a-hydroxytetrahydrobiopterin dehydratase
MTTELAGKTCTPCRGGISPMTANEAKHYLEQTPDWGSTRRGRVSSAPSSLRTSEKAPDFVDQIGALLRRDRMRLNAGRNVGDASPLTVGRPRRVRD